MTKIVPSVIVIFTILCLICPLNALEDNRTSKNDASTKVPKEDASAPSPKNPSSGRVIRPSAWSEEEERELKRSDGRNSGNEDQDLLLFDEQFSLLNIKKFFQYITSLLYAVDESNDESWKKATNDMVLKMQNQISNGPPEKIENKVNDEIQNFQKDGAPNKSVDDKQFQNSSPADTPNKLAGTKKMQNLPNKGSLNRRQSAKTPKIETQNLADTQDNGEMQNSPPNILSNKSSNDRNAHKSSNNKQPTGKSILEAQNFSNKDSTEKSENNMKTQTQNLARTDTQDNKNMHNSANNDSDKPSNERNKQKSSFKISFNNKKPTDNSKLETQKSNDSNTMNKSEIRGEVENSLTNDSLNKPSNNETMQNPSINNSSKSRQPTKNLEDSQQNSMSKDNLNKAAQDTTVRNPPNNNNQLQSRSALKSDKPKEDLTETVFKDYDECKSGDITLDDNTTKYIIPRKKVEKYEDNYKKEDDEEEDTDEHDMNDNETENDYISGGIDINENDMKEIDVENGNENDANENETDDDNLNENNYDGDENKPDTDNENSQPAITGQEKVDDRPITLPKFIIQTIQNQQNYSKTRPLKNKMDNNDHETAGSVKSQNIAKEGNPSKEFILSSNEFMDNYINNPPQRENEQASNMKALNPNGSDTMNKKNLPISIFPNKFKTDYMPLKAAPSISETVKHQNMPFHQSQNTEGNFLPEANTPSFITFKEDRKGSNRNHGLLDDIFSQNVPYTFTSINEPVFATQESIKNEEVTPQKLIPFQQTSYFSDLKDTFAAPQNNYNTFTQPAILEFQGAIPSVQTFHSDVPATYEYRPEITGSFQLLPNKPVPLQNEGYLNNHYGNYNFQDEETPAINNERNQLFGQRKPTVLQPGVSSSPQYILNQNTPDKLGKTIHFTNYKPEIPDNVPTIEKPEPNTEMFSNHMISDVSRPNPPFNHIYNQDSSPTPTGTENNMDKNMPQDQLAAIKPQNQTNNVQTLNLQNQSENQPLQNNFPKEQMLFPHNDKLLQQNKMNGTLPDKSTMSSDRFSVQEETENVNITEDNMQLKPEDEDTPIGNPENVAAKSHSPPAKARSSKPLSEKHQKNSTFDESKDQKKVVLSSDSDSTKKEVENDYLSEKNYNSEDKTNEDEDQNEEDDDDGDYDDDDDDDDDDDAIEDDYITENNYDSDDNENEDQDEDEEKKEDEEKNGYVHENKYDNFETDINRNRQNPETTVVINEKTSGSVTTSPNFPNQVKSDQQKNSISQPPTSHDSIISEVPQSQSMKNKENPSSVFELSSDGLNGNYNNVRLGEKPIKEKEPTTYDVAQSSEISKSESPSSNQGGTFDTILEYIYKFSNNSLFKDIREENN